MPYGMGYDEVKRRRKRMKKDSVHIKNQAGAKLQNNLHNSYNNQLKNAEGLGAVIEINKEVASDDSGKLYSCKYARSCGFGEGKKPKEEDGWEEVYPGKWRKVYELDKEET